MCVCYDTRRGASVLAAALNEDLEIKAREQLARILASRTFHQADRLKRFIGFIVQETLAGRGNQLKEFLLGMEVFGKDARFVPPTDPLVRVQARRLRVRLARYYADEGQEDEILIELPKGEYAPVIKRNQPLRNEHRARRWWGAHGGCPCLYRLYAAARSGVFLQGSEGRDHPHADAHQPS